MPKLTLATLMILASTSAFAKNVDLAYGQSGTHAGGPAGLLISSTGGPVLRHAGVHRNPAYAYAGTHAGGPADLLISSTGGRCCATRDRIAISPTPPLGATPA